MFIDASAFCAIFFEEPEAAVFKAKILATDDIWTSAMAGWETVRAIVREEKADVGRAANRFERFLNVAEIKLATIGVREQSLALDAFDRFGKGRHPAALNMGDCFAYACARSLGVPLLYKGDDFAQTDITPA